MLVHCLSTGLLYQESEVSMIDGRRLALALFSPRSSRRLSAVAEAICPSWDACKAPSHSTEATSQCGGRVFIHCREAARHSRLSMRREYELTFVDSVNGAKTASMRLPSSGPMGRSRPRRSPQSTTSSELKFDAQAGKNVRHQDGIGKVGRIASSLAYEDDSSPSSLARRPDHGCVPSSIIFRSVL